MAGKPVLHYFNGRGRMESVRWLLAAAGVEVSCLIELLVFVPRSFVELSTYLVKSRRKLCILSKQNVAFDKYSLNVGPPVS